MENTIQNEKKKKNTNEAWKKLGVEVARLAASSFANGAFVALGAIATHAAVKSIGGRTAGADVLPIKRAL